EVRRLHDEVSKPHQRARPSFRVVPRSAPELLQPGIHPQAFRIAMVATGWFILAGAFLFATTLETGYLMAVVVGFGVVFFGLTLGLALRVNNDQRWSTKAESFEEFVNDDVPVNTGRIHGREALIQLLILPVSLAVGFTAIGLVFN